MDVTLPNGKTVTGIPDGTNKWTVAEKAISAGLATPEDFGQQTTVADISPAESESRQLLLGGRALIEGAASLPSMASDLVGTVFNLPLQGLDALTGKSPFRFETNHGGRLTNYLDSIGAPQPQNMAEKIGYAANRGIGGAVGGLGLGSTLAAARGATGAVGTALQAQPTSQLVAGATSGASAEGAKQARFGSLGQFLAGILGGAAGGGITSAIGSRMERPALPPAAANSAANIEVGPAAANTETNLTATPTARATGGGYTFGNVGEDTALGLSIPKQRVMAAGQDLGMRTTPGQASGSRALMQMEAKLESQPMTSGPFNAIKQNNQTRLNEAAARSIGARSTTLDSETLGAVSDRLSASFRDAADDVQRDIDPAGYLGFIRQLQDDSEGLVTGVASHPLVERLTSFAANGEASGEQLHSLTSKIGKAAYKQMSSPQGDRDLGIALYDVKNYVDDLLEQGMEGGRLADFRAARGQYRNLMMLTSGNVINPSSGDVRGGALASMLGRKDKSGFTFGRNTTPMYQAARFSQAFAPLVGDSGTATRMPLQSPMDMLLSVPMNLATRAYTSTPAINLAVAASAAARGANNAGLGAPAFAPAALPSVLGTGQAAPPSLYNWLTGK